MREQSAHSPAEQRLGRTKVSLSRRRKEAKQGLVTTIKPPELPSTRIGNCAILCTPITEHSYQDTQRPQASYLSCNHVHLRPLPTHHNPPLNPAPDNRRPRLRHSKRPTLLLRLRHNSLLLRRLSRRRLNRLLPRRHNLLQQRARQLLQHQHRFRRHDL